jgi:hypothetical protein
MYTSDEMRAMPVRVTGDGKIFIDGEQILADYPIAEGSVRVEPWPGGQRGASLNQLTLTLLVGEVTVELRPPRRAPRDDE